MNLQTELAPHHKTGLLMQNPVMMASGTFGYGIEYAKLAEVQRYGTVIATPKTLFYSYSSCPAVHKKQWRSG